MQPIYQTEHEPELDIDKGNRGLWFQRFFNQYSSNFTLESEAKKTFLEKMATQVTAKNDKNQRFCQRMLKQVESIGGQCRGFKTDWQWATGLGYEHPVENGLLWHPTLSVPYLPGSSVKGLLRSWLEQQENVDRDTLYLWFGSDDKDPSLRQKEAKGGALVFHDAIPTTSVALKLDIANPHYGDWLNTDKPEANAPHDMKAPVPVFFLSAKQTHFIFGISLSPYAKNEQIDLNQVFDELEKALIYLGAGAKTGVGYGTMTRGDKGISALQEAVKKEQEQAQKASLSELELLRYQLQQAMDNMQDAGEGASSTLGVQLSEAIKAYVEKGTEEEKSEFKGFAREVYQYLGVDYKKKGKAKERLQSLGA